MRLPPIITSLRFKSAVSKHNLLHQLLTSMPKEQKHVREAQKQRLRIKERSNKYAPGIVTLQVLGSGAKGAPKSLYVFSDQSRYMFNCGEGTQRLAHEHKMKLSKLEHVFVTQATWSNIGGLPGAALTVQDVGVPVINLHGPPGLEGLFHATRRFVVLKELEIRVTDCAPGSVYEDNVMSVKYVPLEPQGGLQAMSDSSEDEILEDTTDYYAYEHRGRKGAAMNVGPSSPSLHDKSRGVVMNYVCRLQPRAGALCLDKCVRFGVPPGPLLGLLKSGQEVNIEGKTIKPSDVCDPDDPGPVFIVVDCPNEDYLAPLLENEELAKHQVRAGCREEDLAYTVIHFTPEAMLKHPKYREWAYRFAPSTNHVVLNDGNTCMGSAAVHRIQHKLHLLSPTIFPLLGDHGSQSSLSIHRHHDDDPPPKRHHHSGANQSQQRTAAPVAPSHETGFFHANTLYSHRLRPSKGSDRSSELVLDPQEYVSETMESEGFPQILTAVKEKLDAAKRGLIIEDFPRIVFLGTGSSIPNKTRNTSAILIEVNEKCALLLDCGEGTYGQLVRLYGDRTDDILRKIRGVYISHLHADHHLGLIGVLQGRSKVTESPVYLLAPKQIASWLSFYDKWFETVRKYFTLVPLDELGPNRAALDPKIEMQVSEELEVSRIDTCGVRHCPNAFGVCFKLKSGSRIVYSGDTMPCEALAELGRDCDVLIHEATMEDDLEAEAKIKMHSTTSQAIDIGKKMNANFTILTHFSQRYAKLPRFNANFSDRVAIAFDNMAIRVDELPLVPILYPALKAMFAEHYEDMENKAHRRKLRLELEKEVLKQK